MKRISDPGGGVFSPWTRNIGFHEDFQKRYVRLTSAVIRKISDITPQNCKKLKEENRKKSSNHFIQHYKTYSKKVPFFCTRLLHPKGQFWREILFGICQNKLAWNFVTPLGKSNLGLDINQRTLNLKFSLAFFFWRLASGRGLTFLSIFGLAFVKDVLKRLSFDDLAYLWFYFFDYCATCKSVIQFNQISHFFVSLFQLFGGLCLDFIAGLVLQSLAFNFCR